MPTDLSDRQLLRDSVGGMKFSDIGLNNQAPINNMLIGGQMGVGPKIPNLDAATPQVFRNSIIVVTQTPTMFDNFPNGGHMYGKILKALIETSATSVSGIDFGYTLNNADVPVGFDGQNLPVPTYSTRNQPSPSFVFHELLGSYIWKFFTTWMKCIIDPDTNISLASSLLGDVSDPEKILPPITSSWSMSMMVLQPDTTMRPENLIDAAFYTAMFPTNAGEFGFQKAVGSTNTKERTVEFKALVQHNNNTLYYGKELLRILKFYKVNFNYATVRGKIDTAIIDSGLHADLNQYLIPEYSNNKAVAESNTPIY